MSKALDRLTLLETFVRIAERGSISAAARDLGLSQPSASRQLAELEERFGAQLIRRTTHELAVTQAGHDLLRDARQLIDGWEALAEHHGQGGTKIKGQLKIVAPIAFGQQQLADIMVQYQMKHPEVRVTWELNDETIRFAESGCDCWIKVGAVPDETLIVRPLARVERLLVASQDFTDGHVIKSPTDAEKLPCIALNPFEGGQIALRTKQGRSVSIAPTVRIATNNIVALYRAVMKGVGFAVMPRWFIADDLEKGRLVDLLPNWRAATLTVNIAYLPNRHQPARLKSFVAHLVENVGAIPGLLPPEQR